MHRQLDQLDGGVVAGRDVGAGREGHLRQADGARVRVLAGAEDLEGRHHRVGHVGRAAVGPVGAEAEVHVDEGRQVALEPARLERHGAAGCWPVGAVCGCGYAAAWFEGEREAVRVTLPLRVSGRERGGGILTWIHPFHAVRERRICYQAVPSRSWVDEDQMCRGYCREGSGKERGRQHLEWEAGMS